MWEQWALIEWDFAHALHLDAAVEVHRKSFRWFTIRVFGLLSLDGTTLNGFFRSESPTPEPEALHGE